MSALIVPVILAGGKGTRLWPLSRSARPKQFLPLMGPTSLFQQTLLRVADARYAGAIVLTSNDYRFLVAEQALDVHRPLASMLLEPVARNTAAAIAAAAFQAVAQFGVDALLHVLPSDHAITAAAGYWASVDRAAAEAAKGRLVTFGIRPTRPETGFGYIESAEQRSEGVFDVARFVEKPVLEKAQDMLASGRYVWNSGMFLLHAQTFLSELEKYAAETYAAAKGAVQGAKADLDFIRLDETAFARAPDISVDYAVFEKSRLVSIVPVDYPWSDLGSWDAVWDASDKSEGANVILGQASLSDTTNSLVISDGAHVAVQGLNDVAVIATADAIFVGKLSDAQKVGQIVKRLNADKATAGLTEIHKTAYRPWGGYASVLHGERFQVKRLFVKPGKKLSLQKHHHRAEHWIVVSGTAEVTIDGKVTMLAENQSIYLPLGCVHRLANPGKILLELIEVQTGSYLGEDDIIRIEDEFGRA